MNSNEGPIRIVEPDYALRTFVARVVKSCAGAREIRVGPSLKETESLDKTSALLIYDVGAGLEEIYSWHAENPHGALIILAEELDDNQRELLLSKGPLALLPIPFTYQQLRSVVSRALNGSSRGAADGAG
jgi:DNA-binding NarL/FixJ family response regulator